MNKLLILFLLLVPGLPAFAQITGDTTIKKRGPQFNFINNDRAHDFGGVEKNTTETYQVQFKNSGDEPLIITGIQATPHKGNPLYDIKIKWSQTPVKPGKKAIIVVSFSAKEDIGSFANELLVTSNAAPANYPLLYVTGAIVPEKRNIEPKQKEPVIPIEMLQPVIQSIAN